MIFIIINGFAHVYIPTPARAVLSVGIRTRDNDGSSPQYRDFYCLTLFLYAFAAIGFLFCSVVLILYSTHSVLWSPLLLCRWRRPLHYALYNTLFLSRFTATRVSCALQIRGTASVSPFTLYTSSYAPLPTTERFVPRAWTQSLK